MSKLCKTCGAEVTRFIKSKNSLWDWCSNKCMAVDPDVIQKKKETNLKKFGGHPMQTVEGKQRFKETFIERYGVDNPSKSPVVQQKMKETFIERYGVDNPSKNVTVVDKIRTKAIDRYEVSKPEILDKRRATTIEKYGVDSNKQAHISPESIKLMKDVDWLTHQHHVLNRSLTEIAQELGVSATPISNILHANNVAVKRFQTSSVHKEIVEYIKTIYTGTIIENTKDVIFPKELDIYLPEANLAIEVDGVFWHSEERGKDRSYHVSKTAECEKLNIHLLHIYDTEWNNVTSAEIVKSKLAHILNKSTRLYARKCEVKEVDSVVADTFLKENHLQGSIPAKIKLGLYYNNTLVGIATIGKSRFNKTAEWELLRYCVSKKLTVVGGLSKLLSYAKKHYNVNNLISYADRRWTFNASNIYETTGFTLVSKSTPNYKYFQINKDIVLLSRNKFQKHRLATELDIYDPALSESENMYLNGYFKIWDCGNLVFKWNNK